MADKPSGSKVDPAGAVVAAVTVSVLLVIGLAGFSIISTAINPSSEPSSKEKSEEEAIEFCKSVRQTISKDDKLCGKYIAQIDQEMQQEKETEAKQAAERQAEAEEAANPLRTIPLNELWACKRTLRSSMKDPDNFKEHNSTPNNGGLIDYTATNSFGGPVRAVFRCTTLKNITSS